MPNYPKINPSTCLKRKLHIRSHLYSLVAVGELDTSLNNTLTDASILAEDEEDTYMESLPNDDECEPSQNGICDDGIDDDDSSIDSYQSCLPPTPDCSDDEDDDSVLAAALGFSDSSDDEDLSEGLTDGSTPSHATCPEDDPEEHPSFDDELQLSNLEMAMLDLLILCDSSGARRGFYDELLTLLQRFTKKGLVIAKAKGRSAFLADMRKKLLTPQPRTTIVEGREVVHFSFLEMLQDLLESSKFNDVDNLCVNQEESDRFAQFMPTNPEDYSEIMSKKWAVESFESLEDFDPVTNFFLSIGMYGDKTGVDVNQRYPLEPWMFTSTVLWR